MRNKFKTELIESSITLIIGLVAVVTAAFLITLASNNFSFKKNNHLDKIQTDTQKIKEIISPYEYKNELNKILIVKDFVNNTKAGNPTTYFTKYIVASGLFEQGFLYIKASSDNKVLSESDNVYVKVSSIINGQYQEFGGHLIKSKSLDIPKNDNWTELLYDLSDIKYKERYFSSDVEVRSADWLKFLSEGGGSKKIIGFSSSVNSGKIIELSIYYKCTKDTSCNIEIK